MYKIGIWDKDESYLWGLVGYLKEHHKDTFEINVAEGGFGLDPVDIDAVHYDALFLGNSAEDCIDMEKVPSDTMIVHLSEEDAEDRLKIGIHGGLEHVYKQMKKLCENAKNAKNKITEKAEKLVRHDKGAKTAGTGTADGLVMHMIAENAKSKEAGEARQYLLGIQNFCDELLASIGSAEEEDDGYGSTEEFGSLQKNAMDSLEIKNRTKELGKEEPITYIIRKRTGEKTVINRNLFKIIKRLVIVNLMPAEDAAMPMIGILAHAQVRDAIDFRVMLLCIAERALHNAIFGISSAARLILVIRNAEK